MRAGARTPGWHVGPRAPRADASARARAVDLEFRGASSLEHNPFVALRRSSTSEEHGEALGAALVYSGNFLAEVEVEPFGTARLRLGIDPETFGWTLEPGAEFVTPRR